MRKQRTKKLKAIHRELCKRQGVEAHKGSFRFFKKLYTRGILDTFLPTM